MRCNLCGFLIIKPQTALHHVVWYGAVYYYLWCGVVIPFCEWFWCGLCSLVNTSIRVNWWGCVGAPLYFPTIILGSYMELTFILFK